MADLLLRRPWVITGVVFILQTVHRRAEGVRLFFPTQLARPTIPPSFLGALIR
jgi:hypothetical protein